jgi:predicted amidohydrolase
MSDNATSLITVTNYALENLIDWQAYTNKVRRLVKTAKLSESNLLCFAEYAGVELFSWMSGTLAEQFAETQKYIDDYISLYQSLAKEYQLNIQPGSIPVREGTHYKNRAYFFDENGHVAFQDKIILTPAEISLDLLIPGKELRLFSTSLGKVGIAICYDSEFPMLAHALVKAGANLILVPSCTESLHGYTRVSISCRARAIENQCYVANSYLVGQLQTCDFFSDHTGHAGVYSPADIGCPADGIIAHSPTNQPELLHAELNWNILTTIRQGKSQTTNFNDMENSMKNHAHMTVVSH